MYFKINTMSQPPRKRRRIETFSPFLHILFKDTTDAIIDVFDARGACDINVVEIIMQFSTPVEYIVPRLSRIGFQDADSYRSAVVYVSRCFERSREHVGCYLAWSYTRPLIFKLIDAKFLGFMPDVLSYVAALVNNDVMFETDNPQASRGPSTRNVEMSREEAKRIELKWWTDKIQSVTDLETLGILNQIVKLVV